MAVSPLFLPQKAKFRAALFKGRWVQGKALVGLGEAQ